MVRRWSPQPFIFGADPVLCLFRVRVLGFLGFRVLGFRV